MEENNKGLVAMVAAVVLALVMATVFVGIMASSDDCRSDSGSSSDVVGGSAAIPSAQGTVKPMQTGTYTVTSPFGARPGGFHYGEDLAGPAGTPIYAFAAGVVRYAGPASGFGHWIVIDHNIDGQRVSTVYGHMYADGVLVRPGQTVAAGQLIAREGGDGEATGPHLHFEVHPGGYTGSTDAVDPAPWIAAAGEPGGLPATRPGGGPAPAVTGSRAFHYDPTKSITDNVVLAAASQLGVRYSYGGGTLTGPSEGDDGIGWDCSALFRFAWYEGTDGKLEIPRSTDPQEAEGVPVPGGYSGIEPGDGVFWPGHVAMAIGHGLMIEAPETGESVHITKLRSGGDVRRFGGANTGATGANAIDVSDLTPGGASSTDDDGSGCPTDGGGPTGGGVDNLAPGKVPAAYEPWLRRAGTMCPQISSALLAGDIDAESSFNRFAHSDTGAEGPAQFEPYTWPAYGRDDDHTGSADPTDIGDAVMAQGRFFCALAKQIDGWIAQGRVHPDSTGAVGLYIAGYNAGPGAVEQCAGMPSGTVDWDTQTQPYVHRVLAFAHDFTQQGFDGHGLQ